MPTPRLIPSAATDPSTHTKNFVNLSDLRTRGPSLAAGMAAADHSPDSQLSQTRHRAALVASWHIAPGSTILELGCGQGDMTAVLAEAVGPEGRVVAVDVAEPSYGAPVTLGESAARLAAGPLGPRIDFRFATDVLDTSTDFPENTFDHVVLAHCSWYFASHEQLRDTLARIRPWARRLWFTEWDLTPASGDQLAHLLAVLIQGQTEAAGTHGQGNVRTPLSRERLLRRSTEVEPKPLQATTATPAARTAHGRAAPFGVGRAKGLRVWDTNLLCRRIRAVRLSSPARCAHGRPPGMRLRSTVHAVAGAAHCRPLPVSHPAGR